MDASVARSSSDHREASPDAIQCTAALKAIRAARLRVVMSPLILKEWQENLFPRAFARKWLVTMTERRLVKEIGDARHGATLASARKRLKRAEASAVEKDVHLVSAALATDHRVLSRDDRVRGHLGRLTADVPVLARIHWVNPVHSGCLDWLSASAPDAATLRLR